MLRSVFLKTLRDHWRGVAIAVLALFLTMWMGLWAYSGVDEADTYLQSMPDEMVAALGITRESGSAGLMFSTMLSLMGPFVFAGLAISMAASSMAGEERDGTMNVLGSMPRTRSRLLTSKSLAIAGLIVAANLLTWPLYLLAAQLTGADVSTLAVGAATVHVTVICLVYGAVALAIGAFTGNRGIASGGSVGFLIVSFLVAGLAPQFAGWENLAKAFPWYYLNASKPLVDGADWAQVGVLAGVTLALAAASLWGIQRRDLRAGAVRLSFLEKLRSSPRLGTLMGRLQGSGSARGLTGKALSDQRGLTIVAGGALLAFLVLMGPLFNALGDTVGDVVASMPDALLAMIGYADYSTPTGWYHGEALSIYAPLVVSIVGIAAGAALAGEEKRRTASVLLSVPVSRGRVASAKAAALGVLAIVLAALAFVGIGGGNAIASLGMDVGNIAAAAALIGALGLFIGACAFLCGAATGSSGAAVWGGTGVAVAAWAINTFAGVNPDLEWLVKVSAFYWVLHTKPLDNGMDWVGLAVLLVAAMAVAALGLVTYRRRDLHG